MPGVLMCVCALVALSGVTRRLSAQSLERREIVIQDRFASDDVLYDVYLPSGFTNGAMVVAGVSLYCEGGLSVEAFVNATDDQILARIQQFANRNHLDRYCTKVLILDIEVPYKLFDYYSLPTKERSHMVEGLKRRIHLFKQQFPIAQVGLFGTVIPHPHGNEGFAPRREGYEFLGQQGVYDEIDLFVPVLYQRFGWEDFGPEDLHKFISRMTRQGVVESLALRDSRGRGRPIYPLLSVEIFNTSPHNETQNDPELVRFQVEVLRCAGVKRWGIWVGPDPLADWNVGDPLPPLERVDLQTFLSRIACRVDYNGNGEHDSADADLFQMLYYMRDIRADLTLDGQINNNDIAEFVSHISVSGAPCAATSDADFAGCDSTKQNTSDHLSD